MNTTLGAGELIHVDHGTAKRLGDWTTADRVHVRARTGSVMLDLRSAGLPDEIEVHVELDRATLKLLVPDDAVVDQWGLSWSGRGKVKDAVGGEGGRRIRLTGAAHNSEFRINRGGVATLFAMCTREGFAELRRAHKESTYPSIVDAR